MLLYESVGIQYLLDPVLGDEVVVVGITGLRAAEEVLEGYRQMPVGRNIQHECGFRIARECVVEIGYSITVGIDETGDRTAPGRQSLESCCIAIRRSMREYSTMRRMTTVRVSNPEADSVRTRSAAAAGRKTVVRRTPASDAIPEKTFVPAFVSSETTTGALPAGRGSASSAPSAVTA